MALSQMQRGVQPVRLNRRLALGPGLRAQMSRHGAHMFLGTRGANLTFIPKKGQHYSFGGMGTGFFVAGGAGQKMKTRMWKRVDMGSCSLNISKSHPSISFGGAAARFTVGGAAPPRLTLGIPGTGFYRSVTFGRSGSPTSRGKRNIKDIAKVIKLHNETFHVILGRAKLPILLQAIADRLRNYPPETEGNKPKPDQPGALWYERLVGAWRATRDPGNPLLLKKSEQLKKRWVTKVVNKFRGFVATKVSYASLVHGTHTQLDVHRKHDWPTAKQVLDELQYKGLIKRVVMDAADEAARQTGGKVQ